MGVRTTGRILALAGLGLTSFCSLEASPKLRLATATVGPISVAAGASPAVQTVEAYNAGDGTLAVTVSSSAAWVTGTAGAARGCTTRGGACVPLQFTFATSALAAGTYTATATVASTTALDAPQTITITVQVGGGGVPGSVNLYAPPGGAGQARIYSNSALAGAAKTNTGGSWLSLTLEGSGSFLFVYPYLIRAVAPPDVTDATYTGTLAITGSAVAAENKTVSVNFRVTAQPIVSVSPATVQATLAQGAPKLTQYLNVANPGQGTLSLLGGSSTGAWATVGTPIGTLLPVTFDAAGLATGVYTGTLGVNTNAANGAQSVPVEFRVVAPGAPSIGFQGVVNNVVALAPGTALAQGEFVALYGDQLSTTSTAAGAAPYPKTLGGAVVTVNGLAAPVQYVSYGQLNFQIPYETSAGSAEIRITRDGVAGNGASVDIVPRAPRIYAAVSASDGGLVSAAHPARAGDVVVLWATGLGATDPPVATGDGAPAAEPLGRITVPTVVVFGGGFSGAPVTATPAFVGLTPPFVGLYQINVTIPDDAPTGPAVGLSVNVDGVSSNTVSIAIQG
jgi:uncharacterized protein (TIGR03437 family)